MIGGPSRPVRAMRGVAVVLALVVVFRVPTIERRFAAALVAAEPAPRRLRSPMALPVATTGPTKAEPDTSPAIAPDLRNAAPPWRRYSLPRQMVISPAGIAAPSARPELAAEPSAAAPAGTFASAAIAADSPVRPLAARPDAGGLATAAYASLAAGDRRSAVRLFDAALAGDDPRAGEWRRQRDALTRRWSASAYSIVRGSGPAGLAVEPVLGGGQSGGGVAFTPDPLARRPLALTARGSVAHDDGGRSGFAAVGVAWHPLTGVTLAAERLIAVEAAGPNDWTVRLAAGTDRTRGRLRLTAYGEGGLIGHATYAAVQGRAAAIIRDHGVEIDPGAGVWSSLQRDRGTTVDRVDLGPGVAVRAGPLAVEVDYRVRAAGNAAPGSGPVVTVSAAF